MRKTKAQHVHRPPIEIEEVMLRLMKENPKATERELFKLFYQEVLADEALTDAVINDAAVALWEEVAVPMKKRIQN